MMDIMDNLIVTMMVLVLFTLKSECICTFLSNCKDIFFGRNNIFHFSSRLKIKFQGLKCSLIIIDFTCKTLLE